MGLKKAHLIAFDADGTLYSNKYIALLMKIMNRHYEFFQNIGTKDQFFDVNAPEIKQKTEEIIQEINTIELSEDEINHHSRIDITNPLIALTFNNIYYEYLDNGISLSLSQITALIVQDFIGYMNRLDKRLLTSILLAANRELITHLCNKIESEDIKAAALVVASNRQSFYTDKAGMNQNGTGSIYLDLYEICYEMRKQLKNRTCIVSQFCIADFFGQNLQRGQSYRNIFHEHMVGGGSNYLHFHHADSIYDERKLLLIYAIAHDAVNYILNELDIAYKNTEVTIDYFDDRLDILNPLAAILSRYLKLLPENVTINLFPFDGTLHIHPIATIKGTGVLDLNYKKNVKLMATMCGHDLNNYSKPIDTISQLNIEQFLSARVTGQELVRYVSLHHSLFKSHKQSTDNDSLVFSNILRNNGFGD